MAVVVQAPRGASVVFSGVAKGEERSKEGGRRSCGGVDGGGGAAQATHGCDSAAGGNSGGRLWVDEFVG